MAGSATNTMAVSGEHGGNLAAHLGDFTATNRMLVLAGFAAVIGAIASVVAWALLKLIGFFTNLFYFGRLSTSLVNPGDNNLGFWAVLVPIGGSILIGLIARFGSERIRGHGIPEAIEAILINGSRIQPRLAVLKPVSSAIAIGSGGPFGAEGPIIMTGGAFGSMIAQFFRMTSNERKTLMVAGAAAGMAATFAAPVAALALAVELLLFEFKPRSVIPVATACAVAAALRVSMLGTGPLFPVPAHETSIGIGGLLLCLVTGLCAAGVSIALTAMVYAAEDTFTKLPIHWMWWPALGGVVIGIGGLIFPDALGIGYNVIRDLLSGSAPLHVIFGVLIVKSIIWSVSLGSGTSGGVLAPMLMMGAATGALLSHVFPDYGAGFWALIGMAAILGGTMRVPFTSLFFALELTHDINALLPLMIATAASYGVTVLALRRSILTEKVARRGFHLSREYDIDPLEVLSVQEVMRTDIVALPRDLSHDELIEIANGKDRPQGQHLYPVLDEHRHLVGVVTRRELQNNLRRDLLPISLETIARHQPVVAYGDEPLRYVAGRMAETGLTQFPVVERGNTGQLLGLISLRDLLKARERQLSDERVRERTLRIRLFRPRRAVVEA
ncbi:MAG: chloride channel protein [Thermomicrobiales bacterium]